MTAPAPDRLPDAPAELIEAGATGHLVVLVGAGASLGAGLPSWTALLNDLLCTARAEATRQEVRDDLQAAGAEWSSWNALTRASLIGQAMGEDWLREAIARRFREASASPTPTDHALAALPGTAFVTTNYDQLLEAALAERSGRPARVLRMSDPAAIQSFAAGDVLKLHGDIDDPASIVLMTEDYYRVGHEAPRTWKERLKALLQPPYQMLLVGYGYEDVDLQEVVNELRGAYQGKLPGPFWLQKESLLGKTKAEAHKLRPIWLREHGHIVPWLEALTLTIKARKAQAPAIVRAVAYAGQVRSDFKEKSDRAQKQFEQQAYAEARALYEQLLTEAEALSAVDPGDGELKAWMARSRLNVGACFLCLQEHAEARPRLRHVAEKELEHLPAGARCNLAEALAQEGDLELARAVLPSSEAELTDDERARLAEASQLIHVLEGGLLTIGSPRSVLLNLHVARMLERRGQLDEAAREARRVIEDASGNALLSLFGLALLVPALGKSVREEPSASSWIPIHDRAPTVKAIEAGLSRIGDPKLPPKLRRDATNIELFFSALVQDHEGIARVQRTVKDNAPGEIDLFCKSHVLREAEELAAAGDLEAALRCLPPSDHPWQRSFERAHLAALAGRHEQALEDALGLAQRFPGRAPIDYLTAKLLTRASRAEEALPHARAAFAALPGRGYRLLLGQCLLATNNAAAAWDKLLSLTDARDPAALRARAIAAEQVRPEQAPALWSEYLKERPDDTAATLSLARAWLRLGKPSEAAEVTWRLVTSAKNRLDAGSLYQCAQLQRHGGALSEETRRRMREIAGLLETRFPGDPGAEHGRVMLLAALGFPEEARPVDYQGLLDAGILQVGSLEDVKAFVREDREQQQTAYRLYRHGHLPFEAFCDNTGTNAAVWLLRFLRISAEGATPLSAPIVLGDLPILPLAGRTILVGELALLLLQHLGLLPRLREALGQGGKLALFADVWQRLVQAATELELHSDRVELERHDRVLRLIKDHPKLDARKNGRRPDLEWAAEEGLAILHHEPAPGTVARLSPRALALHLEARGYFDRARAQHLLGWLPLEPEPLPPVSDPLPPRLCITSVALGCFANADALEALLDAIPETLVVGPETLARLHRRREEASVNVEAADLAAATQRALGAGIVEGWIDPTLARPAVDDLPDVRESEEEVERARRALRDPLAHALGFRQALVDDADLLFLNTDFFIAAAPANHLARALAWRDPGHYHQITARLRSVSSREIHLPSLVVGLLPESEARRRLLQLAELGFTDALRPSDLLDLSRRYGGLDKVEPRRILDRLEQLAREREHEAQNLAQMRLAGVYAKAIWSAFLQGVQDRSEPEAKALAGVLLERIEALGEATVRSTLDVVIQFLAAAALDTPRDSFVLETKPDGNDLFTLSTESPAGLLWTFLARWAGPEGKRCSALTRGLREAWCILDEHATKHGPAHLHAGTLVLSLPPDGRSLDDPALESLAILSAGWQTKPLEHLTFTESELSVEQALALGAAALASHPETLSGTDRFLQYPGRASRGNAEPLLLAPADAVLLRAVPEATASFARHMAELLGPSDGRAYDLLQKLADAPADETLRRRYARMTVTAPWRLVRDDPAVLRTWRWRRGLVHEAFPVNPDHLREMLSEPGPLPPELSLPGPLPPELSLFKVLHARLAPGGAWAKRADQADLCQQACEVPGLLPTLLVYGRLSAEADAYTEDVGAALDRLSSPDEFPAARLASDIFFLRVAAARRPFARLPEGEIDLRERLPARLLAALRAVAAPPPTGTFAEGEAEILRLCALVVEELALPDQLPSTDGLWLTYRLFQWLCVQLDTLSPDARGAAFSTLRKLAPPAHEPSRASDDLLNPFRFARTRFDHRLATVLYAFGFMEEVLLQIPDSPADDKVLPRSVSSTELEEMLASLAARPLSDEERALRAPDPEPSRLGWQGSPGALPDLALKALLHLNAGAFLRISSARRLAWIEDLRQRPEEPDRLDWSLTSLVLLSALNQASKLSPEEKVALESRVRGMTGDPDDKAPTWRWLVLTTLFGAGCIHLEDEVQRLLLEHLASAAAPEAFGRYLVALSFHAPDRLISEARRILEATESASLDPVPFAGGIARVVAHGNPQTIHGMRELLRQLAQRPPFQEDERMRSLLGNLGVL